MTSYVVNDWVVDSGQAYIAIQASYGEATSNTSYWVPLTITGPAGTAGTNGTNGTNGFANIADLMTTDSSSIAVSLTGGTTYVTLELANNPWYWTAYPTIYFNHYINGGTTPTAGSFTCSSGVYSTDLGSTYTTGDSIVIKLSDGTTESNLVWFSATF